MGSALKDKSIVYWYPDSEKHRCGYCKNQYGSISNGMWAESLKVQDYQNLIDRGWRRSGKYCYKPIMQETCCPQYTIKCDINNFSLTKSQKKVIKKLNKYLNDGILSKNDFSEAEHSNEPSISGVFIKDKPNINFSRIDNCCPDQMKTDNLEAKCDLNTEELRCDKLSSHERENQEGIIESSKMKCMSQKRSDLKSSFKEGVGADFSKPPCKKAKLLRLERKKEKLLKHGLNLEKNATPGQKSIENFLNEISKNRKHKLKLELVPTSDPGVKWDQVKEVEFELYRKYQMVVHNDPPTKLSMKGFHRFLVNSPLEITLVRMTRNHEFFAVSAKLYEKYQMIVHNETAEDSDPDQFYCFLVQSPLEPADFPDNINGPGYGSFHQQYWIDDKLVAVGVIDILPRCVSSVYFFYDPDYRNLTLGTYGSLREVQFTRSLQRKLPELSNYYMGFYIHSCTKMRYKGKLVPSFLLCPETYHWVPIEKCLAKLDANKYCRLEEDLDAIDEKYPTSSDIDNMKIIYNYRLMYFKQYNREQRGEQDLFNDIGVLIGRECIKSVIFGKN